LFWGDSNLIDQMPFWKKSLRTLFLRWVYSYVDRAFSVGTRSRAYFRAMGLPEERILFAPHAVDNDRFGAASEQTQLQASQLRERLGIGADETVFLFAGKFIGKKDPLLLIDAFLELGHPHAHMVFIGDGALKPQMLEKTRGHARMHILPFQNQSGMPMAYAMCDVFCLPSRGPGETWGLAVNEAMACGKAVVVSDRVGCAVDLVREGRNGYTFRSGVMEELTDRLRLLSDPGTARAMGLESRREIHPWNFTEVALAFESVMGDLESK
jgi:glycosyltransferase involved in cell wall biosynthesis